MERAATLSAIWRISCSDPRSLQSTFWHTKQIDFMNKAPPPGDITSLTRNDASKAALRRQQSAIDEFRYSRPIRSSGLLSSIDIDTLTTIGKNAGRGRGPRGPQPNADNR